MVHHEHSKDTVVSVPVVKRARELNLGGSLYRLLYRIHGFPSIEDYKKAKNGFLGAAAVLPVLRRTWFLVYRSVGRFSASVSSGDMTLHRFGFWSGEQDELMKIFFACRGVYRDAPS